VDAKKKLHDLLNPANKNESSLRIERDTLCTRVFELECAMDKLKVEISIVG
jgi:hypothetical protein